MRLVPFVPIVLAVILAGCSGKSASATRPSPPRQSTTIARVTSTKPAVVPANEGPRAIAIRYVAATGELVAHSPIRQRETLATLVVPEMVDAHLSAITRTLGDLEAKVGHPTTELVWVESPLTAFADLSARPVVVDVWTVSILAHPSARLVEQVWRTVRVTLTEVSPGRWLVVDAAASAGPTPITVDGFLRVAGWPAA